MLLSASQRGKALWLSADSCWSSPVTFIASSRQAPSVLHLDSMMSPSTSSQELTLLHFNDVYHISNSDLVARFATVLSNPGHITQKSNSGDHDSPILRIFSGDAFSPSLEAAVLRGGHMTELLNGLGIDVACYGNHDFDFGEERLMELSRQTIFPWTLANSVSGHGSPRARLLAGAHEYVIKEVAGFRIGFFGLAGTDWPSNCQHLPKCTILDPSDMARRIASHLRLSEKCKLVIAVTHMRLVEDLALSNNTLSGDARVDLVLGGHDHHVVRRAFGDNNPDPAVEQSDSSDGEAIISDFHGQVRIIKSGTDWRGLSVIRLQLSRENQGDASISSISVNQVTDLEQLPNYNQITPCPKTLRILRNTHEKIEKVVTQPLLHTDVPLDGRTRIVRSQETNLGNMLADAVRAFYSTDIALVNSGAIRCDRIASCIDNHPLCIRDVIEISPFDNAFVVKRISGHVLAEALENSVSDAHTDGRFLQLSGLSITMDWRRPEGSRVSGIFYIHPNGSRQALRRDRMYSVAMVDFIASGFDGYSCFQGAETLIDAEGAITDTNLLLEIFKANGESEVQDHHTAGVRRARKAIIRRYHETDGLPVVSPVLEGRIKVADDSNL